MKSVLGTLVAIVVLMTACSDKAPTSDYVSIDQNITFQTKNAKELRNRFISYWDLRSRHQFDQSYGYELPYIRFLKNEEIYKSELAVTFKGFHTVMTKLHFDDAEQTRATIYRDYVKDDVKLHLKSRWYLVNGTWYRKYDFSLFPASR
jgi:hypothetical protein